MHVLGGDESRAFAQRGFVLPLLGDGEFECRTGQMNAGRYPASL